jgi:hypothetical protein
MIEEKKDPKIVDIKKAAMSPAYLLPDANEANL